MRPITLFTLTLTAMSAAHADGLAPVAPADVRLCQAAGSSGPQVPCVLQDQTWMQLQRPTDPADRMTIAPSVTAPAGTLANAIVTSYGLGLSTAYMPPPSGSDVTDAANFATAQATGARTVVFQAAPDSNPYKVPPAGYAALRPNQSVVGQGSGVTILRMTGQSSDPYGMWFGSEVKNSDFTGFTLDYANNRAGAAAGGVFILHNPQNVRIIDVSVINWPIFGLDMNGGNDVTVRGGRYIRAAPENALDMTGAAIPLGRQTQCINVSSDINLATGFTFDGVTCDGAGFNTWGRSFKYSRNNVTRWSYGGAYVTERRLGSSDHYFQNNMASDGRTSQVQRFVGSLGRNVAAGLDDNETSALCLESWAPLTVIDGLQCDNVGGDGIGIGGKNTKVVNSTLSKLGMQIASDGIVTRYYDPSMNGGDSLIANNTVINTNGSGDGSNLKKPYYPEVTDPAVVVTLSGNDFGAVPLTRKGQGEKWSGPGMLISAPLTADQAYSQPPCTTRVPVGPTIEGAVRKSDVIVGATFVATNGSPLPANIKIFADVNADNSVIFSTQETGCGSTNTPVPAGTFHARLITIN